MIGGLAAARKAEFNRGDGDRGCDLRSAGPPGSSSSRWWRASSSRRRSGSSPGELVVDPGAYPGPWFRLFFSDTLHLKAWLALGAAVLGVTQLFTAAWIFRKLPVGAAPRDQRRPPLVGPDRVPADDPGRVPLRLQARLPDVLDAGRRALVLRRRLLRRVRDEGARRAHAPLPAAGRSRSPARSCFDHADRRLVDELVLVPAPGWRRDIDSPRGLRAHRRAAADPGHRPRLRGRARAAGRDRRTTSTTSSTWS